MEQTRIETLACEWGKRPRGAPHFGQLVPSLRSVRREGAQLVVEYEPAAAPRVAELVAAERLCCAGFTWQLDGATVRVGASPAQLDILEQAVRTA